ncbi:ribonuclease Z [Kineobactrum sediminis]|uniref:Ribonuclease Z n=2 Tax=Kineobactrum sediminis TaxID=1905677 RepID=A0A2N5Y2E1_9GAMM|nr:ribonuclease Z [Kineobactrum sediminis]
MSRAAAGMMSANTVETLEDGLHVALCGAGGPLPDAIRSGPCLAVTAGDKLFIIDAGTNGVRNLGRMRYPIGDIEAVFLTHFHSDHIDGLGEMATLRWVQGNHTEQLPVYGPEGVDEIVDGFNRAYALDARYRTAHHGEQVVPPSGAGMLAKAFATAADGDLITIYQKHGVTISALVVDHDPVDPAVGYLVSYGGRSALVSGDTNKSTLVQQHARDVDLLVHEALAPHLVMIMNKAATETGNTGLAKITLDILDYHASPVQAAEIARDANVGHLLYYHIVPALPPLPGIETAWLKGVDDIFSEHTLGRDGTVISLPANSGTIRVHRHRL